MRVEGHLGGERRAERAGAQRGLGAIQRGGADDDQREHVPVEQRVDDALVEAADDDLRQRRAETEQDAGRAPECDGSAPA